MVGEPLPDVARSEATVMAFWLIRTLNETGWPREKGIFRRKKVVPTAMVERQVSFLFRPAIAIGMAMPEKAIGVVLDMFRNTNWQDTSFEELLHKLDPDARFTEKSVKPWVAMNGVRTVLPNEEMEWNSLADINEVISTSFGSLVIWGFLHPETARLHDEVTSLATLAADLIRAFEDELRPLPEIPSTVAIEPFIAARLAEQSISAIDKMYSDTAVG